MACKTCEQIEDVTETGDNIPHAHALRIPSVRFCPVARAIRREKARLLAPGARDRAKTAVARGKRLPLDMVQRAQADAGRGSCSTCTCHLRARGSLLRVILEGEFDRIVAQPLLRP